MRRRSFQQQQQFGVEEVTGGSAPLGQTVLAQPYVAGIAIETDYENVARFGNTTNALD